MLGMQHLDRDPGLGGHVDRRVARCRALLGPLAPRLADPSNAAARRCRALGPTARARPRPARATARGPSNAGPPMPRAPRAWGEQQPARRATPGRREQQLADPSTPRPADAARSPEHRSRNTAAGASNSSRTRATPRPADAARSSDRSRNTVGASNKCPTPPGRPTGRTAGARALDTGRLAGDPAARRARRSGGPTSPTAPTRIRPALTRADRPPRGRHWTAGLSGGGRCSCVVDDGLLVLPRAVSRFHVGRRGRALPREMHRVPAAVGVRAEVDRLAAVAPLGSANVGGGDGMGFCSHAQRLATGQFHLASARDHLPVFCPAQVSGCLPRAFRWSSPPRSLVTSSVLLGLCGERRAGLADARFRCACGCRAARSDPTSGRR